MLTTAYFENLLKALFCELKNIFSILVLIIYGYWFSLLHILLHIFWGDYIAPP